MANIRGLYERYFRLKGGRVVRLVNDDVLLDVDSIARAQGRGRADQLPVQSRPVGARVLDGVGVVGFANDRVAAGHALVGQLNRAVGRTAHDHVGTLEL